MSDGNRKRRREAGLLPGAGQCAARRQDGNPCGMAPIRGAAVCKMHGGAAPQVRRKAQERLALAAEDAASVLIHMMQDPDLSAADQYRAATAVLDRAGIRSGSELAVTLQERQPWETALEGMITEDALPETAAVSRAHTYGDRPPWPTTTPGPQDDGDVVDGEVVED